MFQSSTVGGLAGNSIEVPSCHGLAKNATRSSRSDGLHQREKIPASFSFQMDRERGNRVR